MSLPFNGEPEEYSLYPKGRIVLPKSKTHTAIDEDDEKPGLSSNLVAFSLGISIGFFVGFLLALWIM